MYSYLWLQRDAVPAQLPFNRHVEGPRDQLELVDILMTPLWGISEAIDTIERTPHKASHRRCQRPHT